MVARQVVLVFLFCMGVVSCDNNPMNVTYLILNSAVKQAVTLKEGTYFVYRDSVSGVLDSFWVYQSWDMMVGGAIGDGHYESTELAGYNFINSDSFECHLSTSGNGGMHCIISGSIGKHPVQFYDTEYILLKINANSKGFSYFTDYYDSIAVHGIYYPNVLRSYNKAPITSSSSGDSVILSTFYNLSQGVVKFTVNTDTSYHSWELLRYHIIH